MSGQARLSRGRARWYTGDFRFRMRPEVQVLPGPLPTLTSRNGSQLVRSQVDEACAGPKDAYLVTTSRHGLMSSPALSLDDFGRDGRGGSGRAAGPARPSMDGIQRKWAWARPSAAPPASVR